MELNWTEKQSGKGRSFGDITIREYCKKTNPYYMIRIAKEILPKIGRNVTHIKLTLNDNRLYIAESDPSKGWKLKFMPNGEGQVGIKINMFRPKRLVEGNFVLEFDKNNEYFYVDLEEKLEDSGLDWK